MPGFTADDLQEATGYVDTGGPVSSPVGGGSFLGDLGRLAGSLFPGAQPFISGISRMFGTGGGFSPTGPTSLADYAAMGDMGLGGGGGGGWRAGTAASVRAVIPRALEGAAIAATIYAAYRELRARGMGHSAATKMAHRMAGLVTKRRRMKTTNPRALRRAMRRIRGARKMFSQVRGLMGVHHHAMGGGGWHRRRPRRRGDLYE